MAGRRPEYNWNLIKRWIKEGRGSGEGRFYIPWLKIQDFASKGRCHRIPDWKNGRFHHLFSDFEERIYYLYSWSDKIKDIREQYPLLPIEETIDIANRLGIEYPKNRKTSCPIVLTTDFLLTVPDTTGKKYIARTAKFSKHLSNPRTVEKFEIERQYWSARNIDWGVVTESDLPMTAFHNIKLFYYYYSIKSLFPLDDKDVRNSSIWITERVLNTEKSLRIFTNEADNYFGFECGKSINITLHLIAKKLWDIDITKSFRPAQKIILKNADQIKCKLKKDTFYRIKPI